MISSILVLLIVLCGMGSMLAIFFDMWLDNDAARKVGIPLLITSILLSGVLILIQFYFIIFYNH